MSWNLKHFRQNDWAGNRTSEMKAQRRQQLWMGYSCGEYICSSKNGTLMFFCQFGSSVWIKVLKFIRGELWRIFWTLFSSFCGIWWRRPESVELQRLLRKNENKREISLSASSPQKAAQEEQQNGKRGNKSRWWYKWTLISDTDDPDEEEDDLSPSVRPMSPQWLPAEFFAWRLFGSPSGEEEESLYASLFKHKKYHGDSQHLWSRRKIDRITFGASPAPGSGSINLIKACDIPLPVEGEWAKLLEKIRIPKMSFSITLIWTTQLIWLVQAR